MAYTSYEEPAKDELVMTGGSGGGSSWEKVQVVCQTHQFLLPLIVIVVGKISVINLGK